MGNTQKMMLAVVGAFAAGFILVGGNKEQDTQSQEAAAMVRAVANMQRIAHKKCPELVKKHTGTQIASLVSNTETDKATYLTLEWIGEKKDNFKTVKCTLDGNQGGISKLVIDGKVIIDK